MVFYLFLNLPAIFRYYLTNNAELPLSLTPQMYMSYKILFDYDATPGDGAHTTSTKHIMGLGLSF